MSNHKICSLVKLVNSNWLILVSLQKCAQNEILKFTFEETFPLVFRTVCFIHHDGFMLFMVHFISSTFFEHNVKMLSLKRLKNWRSIPKYTTHCTDPMMMQCAFSSGNGFIVCMLSEGFISSKLNFGVLYNAEACYTT